jgi:acyl-lipid omega-6 desaturase (Delta-12 desaturase)
MRDQFILNSGVAIDANRAPHTPDAPANSLALLRILASYREPKWARSVFELVITVVPFVLIWALMWVALRNDYWISLLLVVPAAGFLVRLFMIQHDCGHGSFFRHRLANDWAGRIIGVFTLTPYDFWKLSHAHHHARNLLAPTAMRPSTMRRRS